MVLDHMILEYNLGAKFHRSTVSQEFRIGAISRGDERLSHRGRCDSLCYCNSLGLNLKKKSGIPSSSMWGSERALTLESGMGMCRGHDPLFSGHSALLSLPIYHQCAAHVPPSIFNFWIPPPIFSLVVAKILALWTQFFSKISFPKP